MALFEICTDVLKAIPAANLRDEGLRERADLQRLLRDQIGIVAPETLVLAEEFGDWEDSKRRIDLLALDKQANLVVIELKTEEDGGHLELQALRYAAMVSTMTFEEAVEAHSRYSQRRGVTGDPRSRILEFLGWADKLEGDSVQSGGAPGFASGVRIVLVAPDFSKEVTTTVIWLNRHDLDVRCVRLQPYKIDQRLLVDVQQVIPLPEAEDYQVRVRRKETQDRAARRAEPTMDEFWRAFESGRPAAELDLARDLCAWVEGVGMKVFAGRDGFAQEYKHRGVGFYFFQIRTDGDIAVWFQYLVKRKPFADPALCEELRVRLCQIAGVSIPSDRTSGKPKFALSLLASAEARQQFKDTWTWVLEQIRSVPEPTDE